MLVSLRWSDNVQSTETEQEHLSDNNGGSYIMQIKA